MAPKADVVSMLRRVGVEITSDINKLLVLDCVDQPERGVFAARRLLISVIGSTSAGRPGIGAAGRDRTNWRTGAGVSAGLRARRREDRQAGWWAAACQEQGRLQSGVAQRQVEGAVRADDGGDDDGADTSATRHNRPSRSPGATDSHKRTSPAHAKRAGTSSNRGPQNGWHGRSHCR